MAGATFTLPLITVIPGQLITAALWGNEFNNISTNFNPSGMDGYSDTDGQMQTQTAPYPSSVTSHASSLSGEIERIRYQISQILGTTYWYQAPAVTLATVSSSMVPVGGVIDYPSGTVPSANYHLADGTAINRTIYATLFALIGTTFGAGDGSLTFNLPNYTDRMSIAAGGAYALAATGGAVSNAPMLTDPGHTHTQNSHNHTGPSHTHSISADGTGVTGTPSATSNSAVFSGGTNNFVASSTHTHTGPSHSHGGATGSSGTGVTSDATPTNNANTTGITLPVIPTLPPYLGMYKMIRVL